MNAGYAARMAVMSYILERWMERIVAVANRHLRGSCVMNADVRHNSDISTKNTCINVLIIGCGLDALGICSKHYLNELLSTKMKLSNDERANVDTHILPRVKVYEFDAWQNCVLKRQALVKSGLLTESSSFNYGNCTQRGDGASDMRASAKMKGEDDLRSLSKPFFCTVSKGRLLSEDVGSENVQYNEDDYFLTALDFREKCPSSFRDGEDKVKQESILSLAIQQIGLNSSQPTIILSELVLAYLGYDGANATMSAVSDVLSGNPSSMFACLEPVFLSESDVSPSDGRGEKGDGYRNQGIVPVEQSYAKEYSHQFLGKLQLGDSKYGSPSAWMHPLGSDAHSIKLRLRNCGFPSSNICHTNLGEAAAMVARVRRMSNAPNFLRAKEPFDEHAALALNLNCYGVVCVFSSVSSTINADGSDDWTRDICPWMSENKVEVFPIASSHHDYQVRGLYERIYTDLYSQYPAIRKMVNSAMKTDLRNDDLNHSAIRNRYLSKDGNFWVATDTRKLVVGCVGVCLRIAKGSNSVLSSVTVIEYEIRRLAVEDQYRGMGIGKKLLSIAEEFAYRQVSDSFSGSGSDPVTIKFWAVTPDCLTAANKLYESVDFKLVDRFQAGSLGMNVYCKQLLLNNDDI